VLYDARTRYGLILCCGFYKDMESLEGGGGKETYTMG